MTRENGVAFVTTSSASGESWKLYLWRLQQRSLFAGELWHCSAQLFGSTRKQLSMAAKDFIIKCQTQQVRCPFLQWSISCRDYSPPNRWTFGVVILVLEFWFSHPATTLLHFLKIQDDLLEELPDSWPSGRCFAAWGKCGFTFQAIQVVEVHCWNLELGKISQDQVWWLLWFMMVKILQTSETRKRQISSDQVMFVDKCVSLRSAQHSQTQGDHLRFSLSSSRLSISSEALVFLPSNLPIFRFFDRR